MIKIFYRIKVHILNIIKNFVKIWYGSKLETLFARMVSFQSDYFKEQHKRKENY